MISDTFIYVNISFLTCIDEFTGSDKSSAVKAYKSQTRKPPSVGWLKWNTDASKLEAKRSSHDKLCVQRHNSKIFFNAGKKVGKNHILMTEALAFREAIVTVTQKQLAKVTIESDLLVAIKAINAGTNPLVILGI